MPDPKKLNKHGQPVNVAFEKDAPKYKSVTTKPKVIVGANKPQGVSRPKYDIKKVFKTN